MTNADYIRQMMTDDYIAQEFCSTASHFYGDCKSCPFRGSLNCGSFEERLRWLKEEYVGEKNAELQEIRDILSDLVKRIEKMEEKLS